MPEPTVITLSSALPKTEELNGLPAVAKQIIAVESTKVVAVVVLDCSFIKHSVDTGDNVPQLRVRRVEPISATADLRALGAIADRAHEDRTGVARLDVDLGDDLADVFGPAAGDDQPMRLRPSREINLKTGETTNFETGEITTPAKPAAPLRRPRRTR